MVTLHGNGEALHSPAAPTRRRTLTLGALGGVLGGVAGLMSEVGGLLPGVSGWLGLVAIEVPVAALLGALATLTPMGRAAWRAGLGTWVPLATGALGVVGARVAVGWTEGWLMPAIAIPVGAVVAGGLALTRRAHRWAPAALSVAVLGGTALWTVASTSAVPVGRPAAPERPLVLLVTVDGARADRYGGYRIDTPAFDRLAAEGASASLAVAGGEGGLASLWGTLPDELAAAGWPMLAVVSEDVAVDRTPFHRFDDDTAWPAAVDRTLAGRLFDLSRPAARRSDRTVDRALRALKSLPGQGMVWVHLSDPLPPWDPPEPFDERYLPRDPAPGPTLSSQATLGPDHAGALDDLTDPRVAVARYDGEVAWTDRQLGRLLTWLEDRGRVESTLVVVAGLRGMGLDEAEPWFSPSGPPTDGRTRVPLAMRLPGVVPRGERIDAPVLLEDVQATLRALLSVPAASGSDGVSLRQAWTGAGVPRAHVTRSWPGAFLWRAPGVLVRWDEGTGWHARGFPLEATPSLDRARLTRITSTDAVPASARPTAAEVERLVRAVMGEAVDPTALAPVPAAD